MKGKLKNNPNIFLVVFAQNNVFFKGIMTEYQENFKNAVWTNYVDNRFWG